MVENLLNQSSNGVLRTKDINMAGKFDIQRARGTLPGKGTQVRAEGIDVRTGSQQVAQAVSGLGSSIANLGLRWDLIEADTQLNEAKMKARQEHIRLMLALPGLEPDKHAEAYEKSLKVRQSFMPKNKRASGSYGKFLNDYTPQWGLNVESFTKAKLKDNFRGQGFVMQQEAIASGNFKEYFKHLEIGRKKLFTAYTSEEVEKYKQNTIDSRERYVKLQTAQQLELLEVQREKDRDEISKLIRSGQSADSAIESSGLEEKEQFTWFERQRAEIDRRLKGEDIATNESVKGQLESMAYDISSGAITMPELKKRLNDERYTKKTIDDAAYDEIFSLAERKFESYQSEAMKRREVHALGQLVTFPSEEGFAEKLARLTSQFEREQAQTLRQLQFDNLDKYKKAMRDWLIKNKDANADEIYEEGRKLLVHYRKTPDELRTIYPKMPTDKSILEATKKVAGQKSPYPEYPDAFLENGVWKVKIEGKIYRIEE